MSRKVRKWVDIIEKGKKAKKVWSDSFRVDQLDKYYEGFQRPSWWPDNKESFMVINLLYANIKSQIDSLFSTTPQFYVRPSRSFSSTKPEEMSLLDEQASKRELVLNYYIKENNTKKEVRKCILDAFLSFGVIKTFYNPIYDKNPKAGEPILDSNGKPIINRTTGDIELQPSIILTKENFLIERRDSRNIYFDPFADSLENIRWVAERIEYTLDEVKSNPIYTNTANLKPSTSVSISSTTDGDRKTEDERKRGVIDRTTVNPDNNKEELIVCWEIYDIENNKVITIAEGHDEFLMNIDTPPSIEKHPFVFLYFINRVNSPYPIPDIWHQLGPQDEYNITRNQIVTHRKRFSRKYEVLEGAIDDKELTKLEEPYDGLVLKKKSDGPALQAIVDPPLDSAVYFDVEMLRKDFFDISGTVQEGQIAQIEKATTAQIVNDRMEARKRGKQLLVKEFMEEVGSKLMLLIENEIELSQRIAILGEGGVTWQNIHPSDFSGQGEFLYEVSSGSMIPRSPAADREGWLALLQVINANPHIATSEVLLRKTAAMFQFEDKTLIQELVGIGKQMLQERMVNGGQPGQPSPPKTEGGSSL